MRLYFFILTAALLMMLSACSKPTSSYTYVHTQNYSQCSYIMDDTLPYQSSNEFTPTNLYMNLENEWMRYGDTMLPSQRIMFGCTNDQYTIHVVANKPDRKTQTGIYKIGQIWNPDVSISFGSIEVRDWVSGTWLDIANDTTSSYMNVTMATDHELKGTFNLKCCGATLDDSHTFSGSFHILF